MQANRKRSQLSFNDSDKNQPVVRLIVILTLSLGMTMLLDCKLEALAQPPGPELFAKEPRTPLELWEAIDYLVRTGQAKKAVPYIDKFMKSKPDDTTLIAIRNRYGSGSILRLVDDPATFAFAKPLADALAGAARKYAAGPERIAQLINELTISPAEHDYAVRHLREAGPYAVPPLFQALARPDLRPADRELIAHAIGELDSSAIPALVAVLDGAEPVLAVDAATALGMIGDRAAVPFLTYHAAEPAVPLSVRTAAQIAIKRLTGQPFSAQTQPPVQVLTEAAWRYHRHQVEFSDNIITLWTWDKEQHTAVPHEVPRREAEVTISSQFAHWALQLAPANQQVQVVQLSIALEAAVERVGFASFPAKDQATFTVAKAAGPLLLGQVLKSAIADGKTDLAAAAAMALGNVTSATALSSNNQPHPLVEALVAPGRRLQFTAAKAIVTLTPTMPFPGSSRVVRTLAQFVINQPLPRAVVIDGNPNRGSQLAGFLTELGYDSETELTGNLGFRAATASADVELVLVSFDLFRPGWELDDTLANLSTDARTALIPVFVYGPLHVQYNRPNLKAAYPRIRFLVQPGNAELLREQLKVLPTLPSEKERTTYASDALALLARISSNRKGPLVPDLPAAEPAISAALGRTDTAIVAVAVLGDIPEPDAQRSLATVVLDPSQGIDLRRKAADQLVHSIQRFGHLITAYQEARFRQVAEEETDADARSTVGTVIQALHRTGIARLNRPAAPAVAPMKEPKVPTPAQRTPE
jgi:HEAT repeat protein